jgi:enoyl-CoA hydratase/carnithine racemase
MQFAGLRARSGALEAANGLLHGNGGAQYLTHLTGPGRALEYLLSVNDVDVKTAEQYRWVNRAYGSAAELRQEADALAEWIALWSAGGLNATKASVRENDPAQAGLDRYLHEI